MFLSVIIPTRNRSDFLARFLKSLLIQTVSPSDYEVIAVDNGSTDSTKETVKYFQQSRLNLHYAYENTPGLHVGRHIGFQLARSDILVYTDDDIEAFPGWLETIRHSFRQNNVVLVGGKCLPKFETDPPDWIKAMWNPNAAGERILGYLSLIDLGDAVKPVNPSLVFGCNFAIHRSVLSEAGGFHPDGMPDDLVRYRGDGESWISKYIQHKGYPALYHPLASVYHYVPRCRMTLEYFCRRAYIQGISDSYAAVRRAAGLEPDESPIGLGNQNLAKKIIRHLCNQPIKTTLSASFQKFRQLSLKKKFKKFQFLKNQIDESYKKGYAYHREQVNTSPDLMAWVLQKDYWDYRLPVNNPGA